VRYRAQNFNGWGPLSDISYITAATKMEKPLAPIYITSTPNSITFQFLTPENRSGAPLTGYKLYVDAIAI
jgi:hypothetical protein